MIPFGGWEMPVHYTSIVDEHHAVRQAAGLFDVSHMGEVIFEGPRAQDFLNRCLTNDARKLAVGQAQYTLMCNERGGVIDDLYACRLGPEKYLLIINASRIEDDCNWLESQRLASVPPTEVEMRNVSGETGAVALQGPRVSDFVDSCFPGPSRGGTPVPRASALAKNHLGQWNFEGETVWVSRTGYTGEDGFEVITPAETILPLWERLLASGVSHGLKPAGLGARDTLRTEVCYPLYGHELDENTSPIEAGLGYFVALDKPDFIGREVLARQMAQGVAKRLAAFRMADRSAPPRPGYPVWSVGGDARRAGVVVSGTQSPTLGIGIGLAYVPPPLAHSSTALEIEIRGRRAPAVVVPKPFYRKENRNF